MQDEWNTDPFTMAIMNEYVYGRGVTDNKGPILAMLFAVKELLVRGLSYASECMLIQY